MANFQLPLAINSMITSTTIFKNQFQIRESLQSQLWKPISMTNHQLPKLLQSQLWQPITSLDNHSNKNFGWPIATTNYGLQQSFLVTHSATNFAQSNLDDQLLMSTSIFDDNSDNQFWISTITPPCDQLQWPILVFFVFFFVHTQRIQFMTVKVCCRMVKCYINNCSVSTLSTFGFRKIALDNKRKL